VADQRTTSARLARFVLARADEELWALDLDRDRTPADGGPAASWARRLHAQAGARRQVAEQYLREHTAPVDAVRTAGLQRTLCLLAHLDDDHPDFPAAAAGCRLDCTAPLW